jgi:hypothetical protein
LQRRLGNSACQHLLQAKLTISHPNDIYEQEADRVADAVMRMPEQAAGTDRTVVPQIQRLCPGCEEELKRQPLEEEEEMVQARPLAPGGALQRQVPEEEEEPLRAKVDSYSIGEMRPEVEAAIQSLPVRGEPLPQPLRAFMEPRFNADFRAVRIHTGAHAHDLARAVNAQAFTIGHNVVFGPGHYAPETARGRHLIAHELTHVVQQGGAPTSKPQPECAALGRSALFAPSARGSNGDTARRHGGSGTPSGLKLSEIDAADATGHRVSLAAVGGVRLQRLGDLTRVPPGLSCPTEVDPVLWTPERWNFRSPRWQGSGHRMRRSSAGR